MILKALLVRKKKKKKEMYMWCMLYHFFLVLPPRWRVSSVACSICSRMIE
jgi:hypothetical protein